MVYFIRASFHISHKYLPISLPMFPAGHGPCEVRLADDTLDAPKAPAAFGKLVQQGQTEGWLPADFAKTD